MTQENTQDTPQSTEEQSIKISAVELFEKLCNLHREINMLTEDVKQLMQDNKEHLDAAMVNGIAKAYVKDKVSDMEEKMQETLAMIDNLVN